MLRFFGRAFGARGVLTLLICVTAVFLVLRLAGDPAEIKQPDETPPDVKAYYRTLWGLDRPLYEQYGRYLISMAQGDFGVSFADDRPALQAVAETLPKTGLSLTRAHATGLLRNNILLLVVFVSLDGWDSYARLAR